MFKPLFISSSYDKLIIAAELTVPFLSTSYGNKWKNHRQKSQCTYRSRGSADRSTAAQARKLRTSSATHPTVYSFIKGEIIKVSLNSAVKLASNQARISSSYSRFGVRLKVAIQKRGRNGANVSVRSTGMRQQMKKIPFAMLCRS